MANEFQKVADDARRLLAGFSAVSTLAQAFEKVGSLQQASDEAFAQLTNLEARVKDAKERLASTQEAADKIGKELTEAGAQCAREADAIVVAARTNAQTMVDVASEKAKQITDAADAEKLAAMEASAAAETQVIALRAEAAELEARIDKARKYLAKLAG